MNWETILSWGDSITIGARSYLAYPEYAGDLLNEATGRQWHTPIHAVCGYTACDLNRSLTPELQKMKQLQPSLLTIMIGTNDLKGPTRNDLFRVAYRQVLIKARMVCRPSQVLVLQIPELTPGVMYPYQLSMNKKVAEYNRIIVSLANEFGFRTQSIQLDNEHLFDGVHLNEIGSNYVGQQIARHVMKDRGIKPLTPMIFDTGSPLVTAAIQTS